MDGRGTLTIRAEPETTAEGVGVRVTIADSGSGIPPEIRDRLFEPFYTTKEPGKGTGLGLHISYGVVARHGGRIEIESVPGDTRFTVTLPPTLPQLSLSRPPAAPVERPATAPAASSAAARPR